MANCTEHKKDTPLKVAFDCLRQLAENDLVAVPVEPTQIMLEAAKRETGTDEATCRRIYEQMVLAADDSFNVYPDEDED